MTYKDMSKVSVSLLLAHTYSGCYYRYKRKNNITGKETLISDTDTKQRQGKEKYNQNKLSMLTNSIGTS